MSRYICLSFVINVHSEQYKWKSRPCLKVLYTAKYLKYITAEWLVIGHSHSALKIGDRFNRLIRYARFDVSYKNIEQHVGIPTIWSMILFQFKTSCICTIFVRCSTRVAVVFWMWVHRSAKVWHVGNCVEVFLSVKSWREQHQPEKNPISRWNKYYVLFYKHIGDIMTNT